MKKIHIFTILLSLFSLIGLAETVVVFPGIYKVNHLAVDDSQIYISQELKIFIYSLSNRRLINTFGKKGEGPGEFRGFTHVIPGEGHIMINSTGKVSFYSKKGEYLKEIKSPPVKTGIFLPLGQGFVGRGYTPLKRDTYHQLINLYNGNFEKVREIYRSADNSIKYLKGGKINLMDSPGHNYQVEGDRILVDQPDGSIFIFNKNGRLISTIKEQFERIKFLEKHKRALIDTLLLANPGKRDSYSEWGKRVAFPSHFPPIQLFRTSDKKVYVLTHKRKNQKGECFIYTLNGKLLKQTMVPIYDYTPKEPYPLTFFKGKLFQICENQDTEEWELHINKVL